MSRRLIVATAILLVALPAAAGGSWLDPYHESYEAGDTVTMRGGVSVGQLGWVEDGPFFAYLRLDESVRCGDLWTCVHPDDIPLGQLTVEEQAEGWLNVSITFTLPEDIADGEYWVHYCNDPCTTGLGDLIGGVFYVGITAEDLHPVDDDHDHPETTRSTVEVSVIGDDDADVAPEVVSIQATAETAEVETEERSWTWLMVGLVGLAVAGVLLARRRPQD